MIIDRIDKLSRYARMDARFMTAVTSLRELPRGIAEGRYPIDDDMFLLIQTPQTARLEEGSFEAHQKYVDIQVLLEGEEMISYADPADLKVHAAYDEERDIALFKGPDNAVKISTGMFYVMFPGEAHKCCCHTTAGLPLKKAVFKIRA